VSSYSEAVQKLADSVRRNLPQDTKIELEPTAEGREIDLLVSTNDGKQWLVEFKPGQGPLSSFDIAELVSYRNLWMHSSTIRGPIYALLLTTRDVTPDAAKRAGEYGVSVLHAGAVDELANALVSDIRSKADSSPPSSLFSGGTPAPTA
jgi:hypothetical protein